MPLSQEPIAPHQVPSSSVRLDAQMQRRVIALALDLQRRQQETLTADQFEAVAAEAGIEPAFVRQAIAQVTSERSVMQKWQRRLRGLVPQVLWERRYAVMAGLGLAAVIGSASMDSTDDLFYVPVFVAAWLGGVLADKKQALGVGAAMGAIQIVSFQIGMCVKHPQIVFGDPYAGISYYMALCVGSSTIGGLIARYILSRRSYSNAVDNGDPSSASAV